MNNAILEFTIYVTVLLVAVLGNTVSFNFNVSPWSITTLVLANFIPVTLTADSVVELTVKYDSVLFIAVSIA